MIIRILFLLLLIPLLQVSKGQGCSDAGLCSVGNLKPGFYSKYDNQLRAGFSYGRGDINVYLYATYIEYLKSLKDNITLGIKFSAQMSQGHNITVIGLSDIYLYSIYYLFSRKIQVTTGAKIPLSNGNIKANGLPLPMVYQPSLGTYDALVSISYNISGILISIGYQQPIIQNKNEFLRELYPPSSPLHNLWSTNNYIRKGDLIFRAAVPIRFLQGKIEIIPSILPIYHIANDEFINSLGDRETIQGSKGITLNLNLFVNYSFLPSHRIQVGVGRPYITRQARPDGLTRYFVFDIEYKYQWNKKNSELSW